MFVNAKISMVLYKDKLLWRAFNISVGIEFHKIFKIVHLLPKLRRVLIKLNVLRYGSKKDRRYKEKLAINASKNDIKMSSFYHYYTLLKLVVNNLFACIWGKHQFAFAE